MPVWGAVDFDLPERTMKCMDENNGNEKKKDYFLPASIVIVAILISVSVLYNLGEKTSSEKSLYASAIDSIAKETPIPKIPPIGEDDHIRGDSGAPVKVVAYTDFECPFCKQFHKTMLLAFETFSPKVSLVYRNYPLEELHPKAFKEAEAGECVAGLNGSAGFWKFVDRLMEVTPSNNGLDPVELPKIAQYAGANRQAFEECLSNGKYTVLVASQVKDANDAGIQGTPYAVVFVNNKAKYVIPGALPFEDLDPAVLSVKSILEKALQ